MKKFTLVLAAAFLSLTAFGQWDTLDTQSSAHFKGISFTSSDSGMTAGENPTTTYGEIRMTRDGGATWMTPSYPATLPGFNAVACSSAQKSWIVGDSGYVLHSTDYGTTWNAIPRFTTKNLFTAFFLDDNTGWVAGEDGALFSTGDEGATWDTLDSETVLDINEILMLTSGAGWIVGDGGYMAYTSDGGLTWTQSATPLFGFFRCNGIAHTTSILNAFAVGDDGLAVYTNDAGVNWYEYQTTIPEDLHAVRFKNDLGGLICGDSGLIWRSMDGGATWMDESVADSVSALYDITFAGDTTAYICGQNGTVLKSRTDVSNVQSTENEFSISAFPNPFTHEVNVSIALAAPAVVQVTVADLTGRIVLDENAGELDAGKQILRPELSSLAAGMYIIRVTAGDVVKALQVVKH